MSYLPFISGEQKCASIDGTVELLALEQDMIDRTDTSKQKELLARLDQIEQAVNNMKVPASFANQFYVLRGHVDFVRARLLERTTTR